MRFAVGSRLRGNDGFDNRNDDTEQYSKQNEADMWDYSDKVKEFYINPKNVGKIEDASAIAEVGSIVCGDALKLYLKIDENDIITDAKFETFGCGSAIASSSALTEMIKGRTIAEAEKLTNQDIAEFLGGLPEEKMHCSVMGCEALDKAIKIWQGQSIDKHEDTDGEIICHCFGVTDKLIRKVIRENKLKDVDEVTHYTKAGGACTSCVHKIEDILNEEIQNILVPEEKQSAKPMSNIKRMQLVEETLATVIRPALQQDGGDIELIDIDNKKVYVALRGSCSMCVTSGVTLKNLVEAKLREFVEPDIEVFEVK